MLRASSSIELIWQLAARETVAGQFREIAPSHFLCALLKFAEIDTDELRGSAHGAEGLGLADLIADVEQIRDEVASRGIDSTRVRRALRAQIGDGGCPFEGGTLHRSPQARSAFDRAARIASGSGSSTLKAIHLLQSLLESPTDDMNIVLGDASIRGATASTPLLDRFGKECPALEDQGVGGECRALLRALSGDLKRVMLICEGPDTALRIVRSVSSLVCGKECPPSLRGFRFIDLRDLPLAPSMADDRVVAGLLSEAAVCNVVPVMPFCGDGDVPVWSGLMQDMLGNDEVRSILPISSEAYVALIALEPRWKPFAQPIWTVAHDCAEVPWEL